MNGEKSTNFSLNGVQTIRQWENTYEEQDSRVVQMIDQGFSTTRVLG
jgi:hypothetical protein